MMSTKPQGVLTLAVNGHTLTGVKRRGKWSFTCASWPDVARDHRGAAGSAGAVAEFMRRALAGAVQVVELMKEKS